MFKRTIRPKREEGRGWGAASDVIEGALRKGRVQRSLRSTAKFKQWKKGTAGANRTDFTYNRYFQVNKCYNNKDVILWGFFSDILFDVSSLCGNS